MCEKDYIWNPSTCSCDSDKYLVFFSIIDDSAITCDEIRGTMQSEPTKAMPINFNKKN